jgi:hypothetical protein
MALILYNGDDFLDIFGICYTTSAKFEYLHFLYFDWLDYYEHRADDEEARAQWMI